MTLQLSRNWKILYLLSFCLLTCLCEFNAANGQKYSRSNFMFTARLEELNASSFSLNQELDFIKEKQSQVNQAAKDKVLFWNEAYPNYRWHKLMMEVSDSHQGHKNGARVVMLHLAMYDAIIAAVKESSLIEFLEQPPYLIDGDVLNLLDSQEEVFAIDARSAAAAAGAAIIKHYFPQQATKVDQRFLAYKKARLQSGLVFNWQILAADLIGKSIAAQYINYAHNDGTNAKWTGEVPEGVNKWLGQPSPYDPMKAKWKAFTLESNDQFRPGPPPSDWEAEMEELRAFNRENTISNTAWKWRTEPVWDDLVERKIMEYDLSTVESAYASALFHVARYEATIAAWDGKYHYWTIRPFQYDPSFKPFLVDTPNFPGYPAGHTTVAGSIANVLSYLFPHDRKQFEELALECSESRFEGGVHFRTDNEVGLEVGEKVGQHVIDHFQALGKE